MWYKNTVSTTAFRYFRGALSTSSYKYTNDKDKMHSRKIFLYKRADMVDLKDHMTQFKDAYLPEDHSHMSCGSNVKQTLKRLLKGLAHRK